MASVQHTVGGVFQILPEALNRVEIPVYSIVITMPPDDRRQQFHCLGYRLCQPRNVIDIARMILP